VARTEFGILPAMDGALNVLAAVVVLATVAPNDPGRWTTGPPLPTARSEVAVAAIGSRVYVVGGFARGGDQRLVEEFDDASGRWQERAPLPRGMNHVGLSSFEGKLYAFGGFSAENGAPSADAVVYDPATDRWRGLAPVPTARGSISVAVLGDVIHLVGGHERHSVATHDVYDPRTNTDARAAPIPVGRDHMGLVAYGGKALRDRGADRRLRAQHVVLRRLRSRAGPVDGVRTNALAPQRYGGGGVS
jgi:Kelch motif protein